MTNPDNGLTDAAKAEIAKAIQIVREDRFEKRILSRLSAQPEVKPPTADAVQPPASQANHPGTPAPPLPKPTGPTPPPGDPAPTSDESNKPEYSRYWGEIIR